MILIVLLCGDLAVQIATIDSRKILASLPELSKLDTLIAQQRQNFIDNINIKIKDAQVQQVSLEEISKKNPKDPLLKTVKLKLDTMTMEINQYDSESTKKLADYKELLYKPYIEKVNLIIKIVAERKKYLQVLDIQSTSFAYLNPTADITNDVIDELRKK